MHSGQVSVSEDYCLWVLAVEMHEQLFHRLLLGGGAGVGGIAVDIESAFVADADRVGVVVLGVCADDRLGAAGVCGAVLGDVVVIADGGEAARLVAGFEGRHGEVLGDAGGGAVNDDKSDISHCFYMELRWLFVSCCLSERSAELIRNLN